MSEIQDAAGILAVFEQLRDDNEMLRDGLEAIRDHGKAPEFPCHAIFKGDCEDTMRETARATLEAVKR